VQVENALKSLDSAFLRLQANPYFRKQYGNFHPYSVLPLIAKESFLDNARVSSTGAIGYFQLKPDAIDDAKKILISFGIQKEYDPKNPVDNCILGLLYFDNTKYRLIKELDSIQVGEEFTYLAYNGGVKRTKALIEKYQKES
jgi:soluble lytic murein transglycosylase-like protein